MCKITFFFVTLHTKTEKVMRKLFLLLLAFSYIATVTAQSLKEEMKRNVNLAACNLLAYPGPTQKKLTPSPKGKKPFYISHYGRHGSRFLNNPIEYDFVYERMLMASQRGKLTLLGEDVLERVRRIRENASGRLGDLTPLGVEQHKAIARRMYERFPEVFAGKTTIDAHSTVVPRCILSMENALQQLLLLNPKLQLRHDASIHDMYYMNQQDRRLAELRVDKPSRDAYEKFCTDHLTWKRVVSTLFNDMDYVEKEVNGERLNYYLFKLAAHLQNTELRNSMTLNDLFTEDEILDNWRKDNVWWFLCYGATPLSQTVQPFVQRNLLRKIIEEADSCLSLAKPGASLRYGHETCILPLVCLLGLDGYDMVVEDVNTLEERNWWCHKIFPMGSNVQFVFYRSSPKDHDVLFKVLLNENEATLPLKPVEGPYYRWADFRDYYLRKLDSYDER